MTAATESLNGTTNSPIKSVRIKLTTLDQENGERFEQKNYKLIDAVDRNGRLIPFVTIYVPTEKQDWNENNDNYLKLLGRSRIGLQKVSDTRKTVCIYFIFHYFFGNLNLKKNCLRSDDNLFS